MFIRRVIGMLNGFAEGTGSGVVVDTKLDAGDVAEAWVGGRAAADPAYSARKTNVEKAF